MKSFLLAILVIAQIAIYPAITYSQSTSDSDIPIRCKDWQIRYDVNADGSYTETQTWSIIILKDSALESGKEASLTFNSSVASGKVLEAYTVKKTGERKEVPKNNYQVTRNDGYKNQSPLYSDQTTITVLYPDLSVGDTTVFSYEITNNTGMFPDQFSVAHNFSQYTAYDNVTIIVSAPITMILRHESYFLTYKEPVEKDGKQILQWTYQNSTPRKWTPSDGGISLLKEEPGLYISTFKSYEEITKAYGSRAIPKAKVTEKIKALASQITAGKDTPEAQAKSLYDWVTKNITYGGNCIGIGAVVPRDIDTIIENKQGDCKDHATLLQALLQSQDIESDQALINSSALFELPQTPVVDVINHVINYVPSLNVFLDSTAGNLPFGMLPPQLSEKPVLLVVNYKEGIKTPSTAQMGHRQTSKHTIKIAQDGSATGTTEIQLHGYPAIITRESMEKISQLPEESKPYIVEKILASQGLHGTGNITSDNTSELVDTYSMQVSYKIEDFISVQNSTGMIIQTPMSGAMPISRFLKESYEPVPSKPTFCSGGQSTEEYIYEFPETINVIAIPKNFKLSSETMEYSSIYSKSGNILTVKRELVDKTPSNICSVRYMEQYKDTARKIIGDLKSQILISN
ncbi:MAG TPA: hypothetical protein DDX85_06310 [Nitrospiraceae bacterium]|nr:hypothetical protein [Nitrospiraceae bacterium]